MCAIREAHEREQRPLILHGRVGLLVHTQPSLDLGASCMVELQVGFSINRCSASTKRGNAHQQYTLEVQSAPFLLCRSVLSEKGCEGRRVHGLWDKLWLLVMTLCSSGEDQPCQAGYPCAHHSCFWRGWGSMQAQANEAFTFIRNSWDGRGTIRTTHRRGHCRDTVYSF
jgi:hypothetical protein